MASPNVMMEEPHLRAVLGDLDGAAVLDLGCGDGSTAMLVLGLGAYRYVGLDSSGGMIDLARSQHSGPAVRFIHARIEETAPDLGEFDLVISRMALHYVADLDDVVARVMRVLLPRGRFVFSVSHPVLTSHASRQDGPRTDWLVDEYFVRGPRQRAWFGSHVLWHHRTIEDYLQAVLEAGFAVDAVRECEPDERLLADHPAELRRRRRVPLILLVAASIGSVADSV